MLIVVCCLVFGVWCCLLSVVCGVLFVVRCLFRWSVFVVCGLLFVVRFCCVLFVFRSLRLLVGSGCLLLGLCG